MYKVTGKKAGLVWDPDANKPLARFTDGVAAVETKAEADKLKKLGYQVEKADEAPPEA